MRNVTAIALGLGAMAALVPGSSLAQGAPPPMPSAPPPMPGGGAPPAMPAAGAQYYYNDNGKQAGPFTADQIKQKIAAGQISPDTLVWKSGTPNWVAAKSLPELAGAGGGGGGGLVAEAGCGSSNIEISDDFSRTDPDQTLTPEGGKLKFKALAGKFDFFTYQHVLSGDADICVTAQIPHKFTNPSETFGGVIFAGNEGGDFNAFLVSPTGNGSMLRLSNKNVDLPITWHRANGLDPKPGAKNRLRIQVRGDTATFYVNNQQFAVYNGAMPGGAGKLGIIVKSEAGRRDSWKFANFRATKP
jgi:GYF domain 2